MPLGDSAAVALASVYRLWEQGDLRGSEGVLVALTGGSGPMTPAEGLDEASFYDQLRGFLASQRPDLDGEIEPSTQLWETGYLDSFGLIETHRVPRGDAWATPSRSVPTTCPASSP